MRAQDALGLLGDVQVALLGKDGDLRVAQAFGEGLSVARWADAIFVAAPDLHRAVGVAQRAGPRAQKQSNVFGGRAGSLAHAFTPRLAEHRSKIIVGED